MPPRKSRPHRTKQEGAHPGGDARSAGPDFLAAARVRRPFGIKGEMLLELLTDFPNRLARHEHLYAGEERRPLEIGAVRRHGEEWLLSLAEVRDRDAAEALRGEILYLRYGDLPPLPPGVYYLHQIEGLSVFTEAGEALGRVKEILKTGANDVYVVRGEQGEILLPAIPQVIREIRVAEGRMIVRLMEGLV
jgi:16S rRNA processing protein RimM